MKVLEKILEEIDSLHNKILKDKFAEKVTEQEIDSLVKVKEIIRSHMDEVTGDSWIPVEERLPEPYKLVEVTVHCSEWISDYDSVWVPEDEKIHHSEEYLVSMGYVVNDLGDWAFFDLDGYEIPCDKEFGTDKGDFYSVVTAWRPFEELKPYKGGESWIHRKQ